MIIGICGLIGSGKDTIADYLVTNYNFKKLSFADKLKDSVATMFDWTKELGYSVTPRLVLQKFGTECMRDGFYDGIWVSLTKKKVLDNPDIKWVIPDVRFDNEAKMIKEVGGEVWWVKRGPLPMWFRMYQDIGQKPEDIHASEWAWANVHFDKVLENDSTVDALRNRVQGHLASKLPLQDAIPFGS